MELIPMRSRTYLLIFVLSALGWSQNTSNITAPALGYLFDSSAQSVRPILGIPGASLIAAPLPLEVALESAAVPPSPDWLIVQIAGSHDLKLLQSRDGSFSLRSIDGVSPAPDRIVFSPTGSAAALYHRDARAIEVVAGLPDAAALARRIDLSAWDADPASLAVTDNGRLVLAGLPTGNVISISDDGFQVIPSDGPVSALAFAPRATAAVVAAGTRIFLFHGSELQQLAAADRPMVDDIALSTDGTRAFLAYADGTIQAIDLSTGATQQVSCHCTPTGLRRLSGSSLFRLTEIAASAPVLLLDGSAPEPRLWFVPLDRGTN
jgi:hypothetical protein